MSRRLPFCFVLRSDGSKLDPSLTFSFLLRTLPLSVLLRLLSGKSGESPSLHRHATSRTKGLPPFFTRSFSSQQDVDLVVELQNTPSTPPVSFSPSTQRSSIRPSIPPRSLVPFARSRLVFVSALARSHFSIDCIGFARLSLSQ